MTGLLWSFTFLLLIYDTRIAGDNFKEWSSDLHNVNSYSNYLKSIEEISAAASNNRYSEIPHGFNTGNDDSDSGILPDAQDQFFPHDPNVADSNPMYDDKHRVVMGVPNPHCDNAETNLTMDWDGNSYAYFCTEDKKLYLPNSSVKPLHSWDYIPTEYAAPHICMNESIEYDDRIPTFGPHRPLWALYGEYVYLPMQRWLHNLEHGAVVMLYHPCALPDEVNRLKRIVRGCLYRHIITPYKGLTPERPMALLTWGHRLEMSKLSNKLVYNFIQKHALRGPEKLSEDGQYDYMLDIQAEIVSDVDDTQLCPKYKRIVNGIQMK